MGSAKSGIAKHRKIMMIKRFIRALAAATLAVAAVGCGNDNEPIIISRDNSSSTVTVDTTATVKEGKVCLAYCTYYGDALPNPQIVTHINYAFAEVYVTNGEYKGFKLRNEDRFKQVVALKSQNTNLKVCLSFTNGVENSDNTADKGFSAIAADDNARKQFAKDCLDFVNKWNIDGIDMDWEFPGMTYGSTYYDPANDVDNFTLLMKQLRATLGNNKLLTYAGYVKDVQATSDGKRYIDVMAVEPYVDFVNLMTYDMDESPNFQSAISKSSSYWDCKRALAAYSAVGHPFSKILLGIPFYVRHDYNSGGLIDYKDLSSLGSEYDIDNWDNDAKTPYVTLNGNFYGSYDNVRSISIKGTWVGGLGLKGMMYWENSEDDDNNTLARAVWNAVMR